MSRLSRRGFFRRAIQGAVLAATVAYCPIALPKFRIQRPPDPGMQLKLLLEKKMRECKLDIERALISQWHGYNGTKRMKMQGLGDLIHGKRYNWKELSGSVTISLRKP
jgi:hypothetical protein